MENNKKEVSFKINGVITVPENISLDDFVDQFIEMIESKNWACFAFYDELPEEDNE